MAIDVLCAMAIDNWYIIACGDLMNGAVFDNQLPANICGYHYYIICLLCQHYMSPHCSMLCTCRIEATVSFIRYFKWQKIGLLFVQLIGNLCYVLQTHYSTFYLAEYII